MRRVLPCLAAILLLALGGCEAKARIESTPSDAGQTGVAQTSAVAAKPPTTDCYHATAPELFTLEERIGPVIVEERPEEAAKWDDPDRLWSVHGVVKDAVPNWCFGSGATLRVAVHAAMEHCTKEYAWYMDNYMRGLSKDRESDKVAGEKRLAKYEKMLAAQKMQCGAKP